MTVFLFDVDGTLTPSRQPINQDFAEQFVRFCTDNSVSLVTGSDYAKTEEQLGPELLSLVEYCFNCCGNQARQHNQLIAENKWTAPTGLISELNEMVHWSTYANKTGHHVEQRPGLLNFSVVGRNATTDQRRQYCVWDKEQQERKAIIKYINRYWPDLEAVVGGEISIDIFVKGQDKSQVLSYFEDTDLVFVGDAIYPGGNDFSLAEAVVAAGGKVHAVSSWSETQKLVMQSMEEQ